jgi:hypothetical protein
VDALVTFTVGLDALVCIGCWYLVGRLLVWRRWLQFADRWLAQAQAVATELPAGYLALLAGQYRLLGWQQSYRQRTDALERGRQVVILLLWLRSIVRFTGR